MGCVTADSENGQCFREHREVWRREIILNKRRDKVINLSDPFSLYTCNRFLNDEILFQSGATDPCSLPVPVCGPQLLINYHHAHPTCTWKLKNFKIIKYFRFSLNVCMLHKCIQVYLKCEV